MVQFLVRECKDCGSSGDAIKKVDHTLAKYGRNKYQNESYLTTKAFPKDRIKLLQYYREILENSFYKEDFYQPYFPISTIISRIKVLTNGL